MIISLFVLINRELRRVPAQHGPPVRSVEFPASFKYLTHMTGKKELDCEAQPEDGGDGYWRGVSGLEGEFWIEKRDYCILKMDIGCAHERSCVIVEERALVENSFMSWSSNRGVSMGFIHRGNPDEESKKRRILFQLKGGVVVNPAGGIIDYNGRVRSSLGRLRFFSAVNQENEFLLKNGFLIFKCGPDLTNGNRYTIDIEKNVFKYDVYYLSKKIFPITFC